MSYTNFITQDGYEGKKNNLENIAELARKNVINKQNRRDFLYRVRRNTAESEVARAIFVSSDSTKFQHVQV